MFQTRNDFLQLLLDTAKEVSDEGKLDVNEKDDIVENYGKEENDQVFKQTVYTKKSKFPENFLKYFNTTLEVFFFFFM